MITNSTVVRCPQCGELNSPYAEQCVICRAQLLPLASSVADEESDPSVENPIEKVTLPPVAKRGSAPFVIGGVLALMLALGVIAARWLSRPVAPSKPKAPPVPLVITETIPDVPSSPAFTKLPARGAASSAESLDHQFARAVEGGDLVRAQQLFKQGASINAYKKSGVPALISAAMQGNLQMVQWMVENGANVNIRILDSAKAVESGATGYTPLIMAAGKGRDEVVRFLLENGADIKLKSLDGIGALWVTAVKGHANTARLLLDAGANPDEASKSGLTTMMIAADSGFTDLIKVLLEKGADPNKQGPFGTTALSHAIVTNHAESAQVIRDAGGR